MVKLVKYMKKLLFILCALIIANVAKCDEIGFRLTSRLPTDNNAIFQFPPGDSGTGYDGKMINGFYDYDLSDNFYLEGALGYRSPSDIFEYSSMAVEVSPGVKLTAGYFVAKLSEGFSFMPENSFNPVTFQGYNKVNFVTHLTIGLKDPKTGVGLYIDRSHFSNGYSVDNPSLNYSGFSISFSFNR